MNRKNKECIVRTDEAAKAESRMHTAFVIMIIAMTLQLVAVALILAKVLVKGI